MNIEDLDRDETLLCYNWSRLQPTSLWKYIMDIITKIQTSIPNLTDYKYMTIKRQLQDYLWCIW